jgi:hypothetical protein
MRAEGWNGSSWSVSSTPNAEARQLFVSAFGGQKRWLASPHGASLSVIAREHDHQLRHLVPVTGIAPGYALLGVIECGDERVTCAYVAEPCLGFDGPCQESDVLWRQRFCVYVRDDL